MNVGKYLNDHSSGEQVASFLITVQVKSNAAMHVSSGFCGPHLLRMAQDLKLKLQPLTF